MELLNVSCNHCGAPLEVSPQTKFVTCRHCARQLVVKHTDNSAFTEVLEKVAGQTAEMAEDLKAIRIQNEIEQLDREWSAEAEQYMEAGKDGGVSRPQPWMTTIFFAGFLGFFMAAKFPLSGDSPFRIFFLIVLVVGVFKIISTWRRYFALQGREQNYVSNRETLVRRLRPDTRK